MIIECPMCRTRFRLDEAKIKGRGARIRCRRCGEAIVVLKPEGLREAPAPHAGGGLLDLRTVVRESLGDSPPSPSGGHPEETAPLASPPVSAEAPPPDVSFPPERSEESAHLDAAFEKYLASRGREAESHGAEARPSSLTDLAVDFRPEEKIDLGVPAEPPSAPPPSDFMIGGTETLDFLKEEYKKGGMEPRFDISPTLRREPQDAVPREEIPSPQPSAAPEAPAEADLSDAAPDLRIPEEESGPAPPEPRGVPEAAPYRAREPRKSSSPLF